MIAYLIGTCWGRREKSIILLSNQVGYEVHVSDPHAFTVQEEYRLYIHYHWQDDGPSLYGFAVEADYRLFNSRNQGRGIQDQEKTNRCFRTNPLNT